MLTLRLPKGKHLPKLKPQGLGRSFVLLRMTTLPSSKDLIPFKRLNSVSVDSRSLDSQMCEVYKDVHKHIENRSNNEDARRYLIV